MGTDAFVRPYVISNRPDDLYAFLSSEEVSSLFEALRVAQAAWTHAPPAVQRAVPAPGVIHGLLAPVWIPLVAQAQASLLLLAYSPCAERARHEREIEIEQLALIRE